MRLLRLSDNGEFSLAEYVGKNVPPYAILSHTWGADDEEVTFKDLINGTGKTKVGYRKLTFCGTQAAKDHLTWFWVDTCCIDKSSSTELSEAINSMFQWYKDANKCYVYLPDVSINDFTSQQETFRMSRWFTRGWTLQELLAPTCVNFFSVEGILLGDKTTLAHKIAEITGISIEALRGKDLSRFNVDERFRWAKGRETKREEDFAYALLGIFGVHMPLIYGEGKEKALKRLRKKLKRPVRKTLIAYSTSDLLCFLAIFVATVAICHPIFYEKVLPQSVSKWMYQQQLYVGSSIIGYVRHKDGMRKNDAAGHAAIPWLVPLMRPASFAGRETHLSQLDAHISSNGGQRLAIYGLGGCGKTALVLESAYRTRQQQPARAVFWVPAITRESFEQAFQEIAATLHIPKIVDDEFDIKKLVKARLSDEKFGQWLMIVDNADDISILLDYPIENSGKDRLMDYIPHSDQGSIIFTTRSREAALALAESTMALGQFRKPEATELLRNRLLPDHQNELENQKTVEHFLDTLTLLALAIVQAVAFINANDISLSEYIFYYQNNQKSAMELLGKEFNDQGRYKDAKNPIATTWYISFAYIQKHNALAAEYLSFMACISNTWISASMLSPNGSVVEQVEAIGMLKAYAFITERHTQTHHPPEQIQNSTKVYDVHPLVHLAMRGWLKEHNQWDSWVGRTLERLQELIPAEGTIRVSYLPHAIYVTNLPESYRTQGRLTLLSRIGQYKYLLHDYKAAEVAFRELLEEQEKSLGKDHPETLISARKLASTLQQQGDYAAAEAMNRRTLERSEKVLGNEHPDTVNNVKGLANTLQCQGKYKAAELMNRRLLEGNKKELGDEIEPLPGLATSLHSQGKYEAAELMGRRALEWYEKKLGKEHISTLSSMDTLALVLHSQGKYEVSEAMYRQVLKGYQKVIGKEDILTLVCMSDLALVLQSQGKYEASESMQRHALKGLEKMIGKEHPRTLTSVRDLASVLNVQGKYNAAGAMNQRALKGFEKALGKAHPSTLTSANNLASILQNHGKLEAAVSVYKEVLKGRDMVLGKEHPDTLFSVCGLAHVLRLLHRYDESLQLYHRASSGYIKTLGLDHPIARPCLEQQSSLQQLLDREVTDETRHEVIEGSGQSTPPRSPGANMPERGLTSRYDWWQRLKKKLGR
ncbi:hypothetical protein N0V90_007518 [Kalmusia sp. IMI 367209]|nr:hypothetical protein N0V90_007518 [Kalmusia sp. IMI 367209]